MALFKCPKCGFLAGTTIAPNTSTPKCEKDHTEMELMHKYEFPSLKEEQQQTQNGPSNPHDR